MKSKKKRVAVLYGGKGAEHDISALSGKFVLSVLDSEIYDIIPILIERSGEWLYERGMLSKSVFPTMKNGDGGILIGRRFLKLDAVFPVLHGDFGEDGRIQGLLESLGIPFVGCDTAAGAVCADKCFTKAVAEVLGIPTLPWCSSDGAADGFFCKRCEDTLGFPVFIKPARLGSSIGAGLAENSEELFSCVRLAGDLGGGRIIAERYLKNPRELECAFIELDGKKYLTQPGEINLSSGFYGFDEKYGGKSSAKVLESANIDSEISEKIRDYAKRLTDALGVKGLARVDFFLSEEGIYFNEINTMPGMTEASLYPKMLKAMGISEKELICGLVKDALKA